MDDKWYYVLDGNRQGPVEFQELQNLFLAGTLNADDFVWCKDFENWKKIADVEEFESSKKSESTAPIEAPPQIQEDSTTENSETNAFILGAFPENQKNFFIRIGMDRGGASSDYGPYSLEIIKKLYKENRINGKTLFYGPGLTSWIPLADISDYQEVFEDLPPKIGEDERRSSERRPFVARMLIHDRKNIYEGVCRDVSVGGMQVLVSDFPSRVGEEISINVHPDNTDYHFVSSGQIVRLLEGQQGFSFRFVALSEEAKSAIESYLSSQ